MASPRRGEHVDKWRPEKDQQNAQDRDSTLRRERARSISGHRRTSKGLESTARIRTELEGSRASVAHSSRRHPRPRGRSKEDTEGRRRSRSPGFAHKEDDRYRPSRKREQVRDRSQSPSRTRHYSPPRRIYRKASQSPRRGGASPGRRRGRRSVSRERVYTRERARETPVREALKRSSPREARYSSRTPPRRRSPDSYIPSKRRRSRTPTSSTYRPTSLRHRIHSPIQPRRSPRRLQSPPELLPEKYYSRHRSRSTSRHPQPQRHSRHREENHEDFHKATHYKHQSESVRRHRSPSSARRNYRSRDRNSRERSPASPSHRNIHRRDKIKDDMRPSYSYYGRGGPPRSNRPSVEAPSYAGSPPPYMAPPQISPQPQSPYGGRGAWPPPNVYGSQQGSPVYPQNQSPYRQNSYPPPPSPGYFPPPPPPPPPHHAAQYGVTPPHLQPPPYPNQTFRGGYERGNHFTPPDRRHSSSSSERLAPNAQDPGPRSTTRGRGHYSNLSWTPATGSRGGIQIPPRNRHNSGKTDDATDEDDNPFRPSKDLQVEDQSAKEAKEAKEVKKSPMAFQPTPPRQEGHAENKIKFALKSKPLPPISTPTADLTEKLRDSRLKPFQDHNISQSNRREYDERNSRRYEMRDHRSYSSQQHRTTDFQSSSYRDPDYRNDFRVSDRTKEEARAESGRTSTRKIMRTRPRPTLPPEFVNSESVYYRKPGNESVVGSGTYGKVFKAIHVYTGDKVALKKIRMEGERDGFPVTAIREVKLLQSLKHDNVVKLQEVMVEKNDCYMVFEYLSHDLTGLLNHPTFALDHSHKKHLAKQLFEGLDYLHRRGVLHRDIKAANILISNSGQLKLADFGLARFFAKRRQLDYTNRVITIWYRSPELLLGETQYGPAVDIWSAACVLVEIFTKHAIFPGDGGEINQLDRIYNVLGTPTRAEWPGVVDMAWFELLRPSERKASTFQEKYRERVTPQAFELLKSMFSYDPKLRPSAADVLEHPYFVLEEPAARQVVELANLEGDWHEFESKALRKEKEKTDREMRRAKEVDAKVDKKRPGDTEIKDDDRDAKRARKDNASSSLAGIA